MEILRFRVPLPLRLAHLNVHLIAGRAGWALVDTGMGVPACREALTAALQERGLEPRQLTTLFVTHYHGDHWGLASWLQAAGVRVIMSRRDGELLQQFFHEPAYGEQAAVHYRSHGVPAAALVQAAAALAHMRAVSPPFLPDALVDDGEMIDLAGEPFEVVITPGHSPGHACLHHHPTRTLLVGDHVLPHITPNIAVDYGSLADPLTAYRASLRRVRGQGFSRCLPAHGDPIEDLDRRVDEILQHHREREERLLTLLAGERSAFELCDGLFNLATLDGWETWMALGETLAHLHALQTAGRVTSREGAAAIRFRRADEG